jgi:hypothetical protein
MSNYKIDFSKDLEPQHDESYSKLTRKVLFEKYEPHKRKDGFSVWSSWSRFTFISPGVYTREIDNSEFDWPLIVSGTTSLSDAYSYEDYYEKSYEAVVEPDLEPVELYTSNYKFSDKEFSPP